MLAVKIRWAAFRAVILRKGLVRHEAGAFVRKLVNALAEADGLQATALLKSATRETEQERVEVRVRVRHRKKYAAERNVISQLLSRNC